MNKELKYGVHTTIPARVGMMSLVGIGSKEYPLGFGNYFSFAGTIEDIMNGRDIRCLNFWAENLNEAARRFLPDGMVRVILYSHENGLKWAVVDDERIPPEWYHNKLCFTGCRRPPQEFAEEIYNYFGDDGNEFEQFTDPKSYWDSRGWKWHPNGVISSKAQ